METVERRARALWPLAAPFIVARDGAAAELWVIDLPVSGFRNALLHFKDWAPGVIVKTAPFAGRELDDELVARYENKPAHAHFVGSRFSMTDVQLFMDPNERGCCDLEVVIWPDLWFPEGMGKDEHFRRFVTLVELAECMRADLPGSTCMISPEHSGDPRELLGTSRSVTW